MVGVMVSVIVGVAVSDIVGVIVGLGMQNTNTRLPFHLLLPICFPQPKASYIIHHPKQSLRVIDNSIILSHYSRQRHKLYFHRFRNTLRRLQGLWARLYYHSSKQENL